MPARRLQTVWHEGTVPWDGARVWCAVRPPVVTLVRRNVRRRPPLLSILLGSCLLVLISASHVDAGCGDYLWQHGRPVLPGHTLSWPTWQPTGATVGHSTTGLGHATLPAEQEQFPCVTGDCDRRHSAPFPSMPPISLRSLDAGLLSTERPSLEAPGGSAREDGDTRVMAITHSSPPDRPPRG